MNDKEHEYNGTISHIRGDVVGLPPTNCLNQGLGHACQAATEVDANVEDGIRRRAVVLVEKVGDDRVRCRIEERLEHAQAESCDIEYHKAVDGSREQRHCAPTGAGYDDEKLAVELVCDEAAEDADCSEAQRERGA